MRSSTRARSVAIAVALLIAAFGGPAPTRAEPSTPDPVWHRAIGSSVEGLATDDAGNVYVTGFAPSKGSGYWTMMLRKLDPDGRRVWWTTWSSPSRRYPHAAGFDVAVPPAGDVVYVAGAVMNDSTEVCLTRLWAYSPDGRLVWTLRSARSALSVAVGAGADGLVAGGHGWLGAWAADGSPLWSGPFEDPAGEHCDAVEGTAVGSRGEIYAVGFLDVMPTCGAVEGGDPQDADIVIQKRSSSGTVLWSRILTDAEVDNDEALSVDVVGRRILVSGEADGHAWLARVSPGGEIEWERSWGKPGITARAVGVSVAPSGPVYAVADLRRTPSRTHGALVLRRYGLDGRLESARRTAMDGGKVASGVATAPGGVVYVAASLFAQAGDLWRIPS